MTDAEAKAMRNADSVRHEQQEVKAQRDKGNMSYRVAREVDTLTGDKHNGIFYVCDCKGTDNDIFYLEAYDVDKILDERLGWLEVFGRYGVPVVSRFHIHFKRHRSRNKKYIIVTEDDRGCSIKVTRGQRISTQRVGAGNEK